MPGRTRTSYAWKFLTKYSQRTLAEEVRLEKPGARADGAKVHNVRGLLSNCERLPAPLRASPSVY